MTRRGIKAWGEDLPSEEKVSVAPSNPENWTNPDMPPVSTENLGTRFVETKPDTVPSWLQANIREARMANKIAAETPIWVMPEFVNQLDISSTPLKKYTPRFQSFPIWLLKAEGKLYKDRFGWISVSWNVNPVLNGQEWMVRSYMSFAPASSGSFANEKFEEFKQVVSISGQKGFAVFGIESKVLEVKPDDVNAAREINGIIAQHDRDLDMARKYWKQQSILFKRQFGGLV